MADQSPDDDLDVTLRWPGGSSAGTADPVTPVEPPTGEGPVRPDPPRPSAPRMVRVRPGGSAMAALRVEIDELRAQVEALAAEVAALRDESSNSNTSNSNA